MTKKTTTKKGSKAAVKKGASPKNIALAEKAVFLCIALAIVLSMAQFTLHGIRYKRLINESTYQVVTLTNGQTFFGKMQKYGFKTYALVDVYYIQSAENTEQEQPITVSANEDNSDELVVNPTTTAPKEEGISLVPLVGDFHQPYNHIVLPREQIVFWQNLQPSSPVLDAIAEIKSAQ